MEMDTMALVFVRYGVTPSLYNGDGDASRVDIVELEKIEPSTPLQFSSVNHVD